ncbi:hypothetical protein CTA2_513 [Colletotrichum tanaceti]|uniref:Uncharacterized protein n=1 Tax=Colletotrichum tanaceti TaxID=1306861 RepID=A0A4U6XHB3_9PEZI|nr:hypothetical protein CTA2_513 [Colletotrichum tanaceti]TKW55121.1 hypothetical protein CTA1_6964 [Colletotrichum tanaceti]
MSTSIEAANISKADKMSTPILYSVDLSANPDPVRWPDQVSGYINISKVDVMFMNINTASDFRMLRTGTNEHVHLALMQVAKHVARGLYRVVS